MKERLPKGENREFPKGAFEPFKAQALVVVEMLGKDVSQKDIPEFNTQLDILWTYADEIAHRSPKQGNLSVGNVLVEALEELKQKRTDLKPHLKELEALVLRKYGISLT